MPYIKPERRAVLDTGIDPAMSPGDLNYQLTKLAIKYIATHTLSYQTINDVLGALEGAKLEFYRRVAAPYEDGKIAENGDVFP